jgi:hypothetical protein
MCFIFLNACLIYRIKYEIVVLRSNVSTTMGLMVSNITVWYQSQGFDAEPRWAS